MLRLVRNDPVVEDDKETATCAECQANWSMALIREGHATRRLRIMGFAFIDFGDTVWLNRCPHCELPTSSRLEFPWPISPLFH